MAIQDRFCPKCGSPSMHEGICHRCSSRSVEWFVCPRKITSVQCPTCDAIKQGNTWSDTSLDRQKLAQKLVRKAVTIIPNIIKPSLQSNIVHQSPNRSLAFVTLNGVLHGTAVNGECTIEIFWKKESCDRCSRISGNYFEGVIQVRAVSRHPGPFEVQTAAAIAYSTEEELQSNGERLSFISDIIENRDGLDITVGSQHIGLLITQRITSELGGRYSTHPKLVGEKNGKPLYRITYSIRLPKYQKQDILKTGDRYVEVEYVDQHNIRIFDLIDGTSRSLTEATIDRIIGNSRRAEHAMVVYTDGDIAGILDPETCITHECSLPKGSNLKPGDTIRMLRDGDHLIVVG